LAASTVGIQTILQPDRPASSTATGLIPPMLWLSVIAPKARIPGTAFVTTLWPVRRWEIVRFQDEAFQAPREEFFGQIEIVDAARDHVRRDVDLKIVGPL
jgi:hypothetical protein